MVMAEQAATASVDAKTTVITGGTRSDRTTAVVAELFRRLAEDSHDANDRPAWLVVSRTARVGDAMRRVRAAAGSSAGRDHELIRVVTAETIARHLVEADGDLVAVVPDRIVGSELARRTLVVQAIAATKLTSSWALDSGELLGSAIRVLDGLADAGIAVSEAERWQRSDLRRLDRRTDGDDGTPHSSLRSLRQMAKQRLDLLAIAAQYERLKRERGLLDRSDVFRRATWLAERGSPRTELVRWSALAIDDLDQATAEERRLFDALDRGGAAIAACSVGHFDESAWPPDVTIERLGDTAQPADAIERALLHARTGTDQTPQPLDAWPGVRAEAFAAETNEDAWIVESIGKALAAGIDPGTIAVVPISAERVPAIERRMLDQSIPCRRVGHPLRSGTTATGDLLAVADLLVDPNDAVATTRLARSPRYLRTRISARDLSAPDGKVALAADVARWLRTAADRGPQHALVQAIGDLGIERVLAISHERWTAGELRAVRSELDYLDDPAHSQVTRSAAIFRIALRSIVGPSGALHAELLDDRVEGCVSLAVADAGSGGLGPWDHVYLVGLSDEAIDGHHRLEDETLDPASLPLAMLGDPLEVPLGAGGRTVDVLGRRMRRRREDNCDAWLVEVARSAGQSLSLSAAVAPRRSADVYETRATESRTLSLLKSAGLKVRRPPHESSADVSEHARHLSPPKGTSLLLVEGGVEEAIASHPQASRIRQEVDELVAHLTPGANEGLGGFAPRELSARELFLAETDPDRYVQEVMLDLPEPPSAASDRTARLRAWLELDASGRTDLDGHGVLVADGPINGDPVEQMALLRGVQDRDLDLPGVGSDSAIAELVDGYKSTPYGSMILNDGGRSLFVISQGRLVRSRLFGVIDQPDGIWQVIDVRVGPATALDWYRLGVQALALSSPSRSLGCCRLVVVGLGDQADIEVRPSPPADHLTRRLALQWQIVDLVGS